MRFSSDGLNVVILDACRDNPFPASSRSIRRGLASMLGPHGSLIEYSTGPGEIAVDGEGNNSPFSSALAEIMLTPNLTIERFFRRVRAAVSSQTGGKQVPWEGSSFIGEFYFTKDSNFGLSDDVVSPPPITDNTPDRRLMLTINFDKVRIGLRSYRQLDNVAKALLDPRLSDQNFTVAGHTAISGQLGYNVALSQRRAVSVVAYLASRGVAIDRLHPVGYGPLALLDVKNPDNPANARVEIIATP